MSVLTSTPLAAPPAQPRWGRRLAAATAGLLAAGVALGMGELVGAFVGPQASPVLAVGSTAIDATPEWLKAFAIRRFGTNDKLVLLSGIFAVLALAAIAIGLIGLRRRDLGLIGILLFGAVGAAAALSRPTGGIADALPALAGAVAGAGALSALLPPITASPKATQASIERVPRTGHMAALKRPATTTAGAVAGLDRRRFLLTALAAGGVAATSGLAGRKVVARRYDILASRAAVRIPPPASAAPPMPTGAALGLTDLSPFITPNSAFYRVDSALAIPKIAAETWKLRIHGMVEREIELNFKQLLARPLIERDITLTCVSNEVGGSYAGNARWVGAPLADLLKEAGVKPGADQLVSRSIDGMTIGTPMSSVLDGRNAMLAVSMNGEPLPLAHGFPVRMVVPGLYGYVSATKWVVDLEATTFAAFDPYWTKRGWARNAPIKTMARIDTPRPLQQVRSGRTAVAGVAWAQHRGVQRVEVRVDGGPWRGAELAAQDSVDTWRQWIFEWEATHGRHTLEARATDDTGVVQTEKRAEPYPSGASGWHSIVIFAT